MVDFIAKAGVDVQSFKASTNINVSAPRRFTGADNWKAILFITRLIRRQPDRPPVLPARFLAVFSYAGYSYTSHGYARDYGFGNAVA